MSELRGFLDWAHERIEKAIREGSVNPPKLRLKQARSGRYHRTAPTKYLERAIELVKQGFGYKQIVERIGCSYNTAVLAAGRVRGARWAGKHRPH